LLLSSNVERAFGQAKDKENEAAKDAQGEDQKQAKEENNKGKEEPKEREPFVFMEVMSTPPLCDELPKAKLGDILGIHYEGYLEDGTLFDSSILREEPMYFELGNAWSKAFDQALTGMCVGERRIWWVPPELGLGDKPVMSPDGSEYIPASSTLQFGAQLMSIESKEEYKARMKTGMAHKAKVTLEQINKDGQRRKQEL